jgi:hypothetical protein
MLAASSREDCTRMPVDNFAIERSIALLACSVERLAMEDAMLVVIVSVMRNLLAQFHIAHVPMIANIARADSS